MGSQMVQSVKKKEKTMSQDVHYLNDENFLNEIESGVTLVDFYADWCGPCRMIAPIIETLATKMLGKAKIAKIDVDASQATTVQYNVTSIPTLIVFKNGQEVSRVMGIRDEKALESLIQSAVEHS